MKYIKVESSQVEQPKEVDMTSSPHIVYLRKNIKKVKKTHDDGNGGMIPIEMWEYDECQMTKEEYESMQNALESPAVQTIMQGIAGLELSIAMQGVEFNG